MDAVRTHALTKYYGKNRGITGVDLAVRKGEIYGFIGPNGAGKSTTIKLLLDFIKPTSGSAAIFGLDCSRESVRIKAKVGYIPAEVNYYEGMKVAEILAYSARFYRKNCTDRIAQLCAALDLDTARRVEELSTGNKKKVAIVQALLHEPELLIMDEPTSGLDPLVQNAFYDLIKAERDRGATIFFSSHILGEVQRICDRVGLIREGNLIEESSLDLLTKARYKRIKLVSSETFDIEGADEIIRRNGGVEFIYSGDIGRLLRTLTRHPIDNLWVEDPSLEEIFMTFYRKGELGK